MAQNNGWYYKKQNDWEGPFSEAELQGLYEDRIIQQDTRVAIPTMKGNRGIPYHSIDAIYHVWEKGDYISFFNEHSLWHAISDGEIQPNSKIISPELKLDNVAVSSLNQTNIRFYPSVSDLIHHRADKSTTVFSGPNNSGKTYLLKQSQFFMGKSAYLLLPSRYQHLGNLSHHPLTDKQASELHARRVQELLIKSRNTDDNVLNIQQILGSLSTSQQDRLLELVSELLDINISLQQIDPDARMSPWYLNFGGQDFALSSSGTRLLFMLLATCMIPVYEHILIDEPELGLSPKIQRVIADLFFDLDKRERWFPHIKRIWISTHSHIFLDKSDITNNFQVTKSSKKVSVEQVQDYSAFHQLQFGMLGNELASLSLPSLIMVVEGKSDHLFMQRLMALRYPEQRITIVMLNGSGANEAVNTLRQALGDIQSSPYRDRIVVVLDKNNSTKKRTLLNSGLHETNIIEWSQNGIEYYYPSNIIREIFGSTFENASEREVTDTHIKIANVRKPKVEVAQIVASRMNESSVFNDEFKGKLLNRLDELLC